MAGTNGPTSAAGTGDTKNPDAQPGAGAEGRAAGEGKAAGAGAVDVETPTAKPGDEGFSLDKDAQD